MCLVYIYALCEPNSEIIRYVGKTANSPEQRLRSHLAPSSLKPKNHRTDWLRSLVKQGLKPALFVLEETTDDCWQEAECRWIAQLRSLGCDLVNSTNGGDGVSGNKPSEATKQLLSSIHKGRPRSEQAKRSISIGWSEEDRELKARARQGILIGGTSNYVGVSFHRASQRWRASIYVNTKQISCGYHDTPEQAAQAYNAVASRHYGDLANLNAVVQ
jgi:hypothetical protein